MNREQKAQAVDEIAAQIDASEAVYAIDYQGLSVAQAAQLRRSLRDADASFRVVKNSLSLRAADKSGAPGAGQLRQFLEEGPTAFAFVRGDPALAAKALAAFSRKEDVLDFKGGVLAGDPVSADVIRGIARLPGRAQLDAQLAGLVASPITGLVRGLGWLLSGLAVALKQVQDNKEAAG